MAFEESNGSPFTMPVTPMYGNGNGNGFGFGGDWAWIILLLLLGWGNNGWGGNGGFDGGLYPWMNQTETINDGFRDQMLNTNVSGIRDAVTGISTQLCNGFSQAEISANARQMADMNRSFDLQSQLASCCCENRLGLADLKYTIATEECATRSADAMNTRDIIDSQNRGTQAVLDKLCALELDSVKQDNANLRTQLNMANLAASQTAQTSRILADNAAQTVALEQYLNPVPVPAYVVQNPNCCTPNTGCGCGCGSF